MPSLVPLADIALYQTDTEASIRLYYSNAQAYLARFTGYSPSQIASELAERLLETERRSVLVVLARVEAAFRQDYLRRGKSKDADAISVTFRRIYAEKFERARFDDDILETWRENLDPVGRAAIGKFRGMLKDRHWLAHGRYWNPGAQHRFQDVYFLADAIVSGFPFRS